MRGGVGLVLVLAALLVSPLATADDSSRPAVLVGGGLGINGLGDLPGPVFEGHVGGGLRTPTLMMAGLFAYAYTESKPLLAYWSIARHELEAVGLVAFWPISQSTFNVHGQLGIGAAFDRLDGVDPETSASRLSGSIGAGVGWGPAALTFRFVMPDPEVCSGPRCFHAAGGAQVLLSVTFELVALIR
jgi:hypothetical protein